MDETNKEPVQMYYPPDAGGPREMILTGVGHFEKGKLTSVADREIAEGIEKRGKGPRIATAEDLATAPEKGSASTDEDRLATGEDDDPKPLAGVGRKTRKGEQLTTG